MRDLTVILPLGLAAAVSPMMLTEQTVLLAGRGGRRAAGRYALGTAVVAAAYLVVLVLSGHVISLPKRPTLSATMDIVAGVVLVLVAAVLRRRHPAQRTAPSHASMGPAAAFGFGLFSMATNFTSLALLLPAAKDVAADVGSWVGRGLLIVVLVVLATIPAWVPLAATSVAPGPAGRALGWISTTISRHGRQLVIVLLALLGVVLAVRGIWRLA